MLVGLKNTDKDPRDLTLTSTTLIVQDDDQRYVLLFENDWSINWALEKNKGLTLLDIRP